MLELGVLAWWKYAAFGSAQIHELFEEVPVMRIALPIGISFFTFHDLSSTVHWQGVADNPAAAGALIAGADTVVVQIVERTFAGGTGRMLLPTTLDTIERALTPR